MRLSFIIIVQQVHVLSLRTPKLTKLFSHESFRSAKLQSNLLPETALPQLRFAYHVLGLDDATELVRRVPEFLKMPVTTSLAPKHAATFQEINQSLTLADIESMCYSPHSVEARALASAFRRGGRYAAKNGDSKILEAMLLRGYHAASDRDRKGASALHWSSGHGHQDCVKALLEGHLSPSDRDINKATPLHWAAAGVEGSAFGVGAKLETMIQLIQAGAIVDAETHDKVTPLHWAAWSGSADAIRLLVRYRADPARTNIRGCGAPHWAAAGGHVSILRILRDDFGLDLITPNHAGHTPLAHAVAHHRSSVVDFYLQQNLCDQAAVEYALSLASQIRHNHFSFFDQNHDSTSGKNASSIYISRHHGDHNDAVRIAGALAHLPQALPRL
uniref:Uncharacterized protein n=1 Tax=Aureoumbra lagunensis TaxID=44058 RepID=A0A7S3JVB4_9STRA